MKKTLATLTVLIITCTFSATAFATPEKQGKGKGQGFRHKAPRVCMNLTGEQQKKLGDLHQRFIDDTYEVRTELMGLNQKIRMYMETSNPDPAKLKSMVIKRADLAKDLAVKRVEFALDAGKISPELKHMGMGPGFGESGMGFGLQGRGGHGHHEFGKRGGGNGPCMMGGNQGAGD